MAAKKLAEAEASTQTEFTAGVSATGDVVMVRDKGFKPAHPTHSVAALRVNCQCLRVLCLCEAPHTVGDRCAIQPSKVYQ